MLQERLAALPRGRLVPPQLGPDPEHALKEDTGGHTGVPVRCSSRSGIRSLPSWVEAGAVKKMLLSRPWSSIWIPKPSNVPQKSRPSS